MNHKTFFLVAGGIFGLVALLHLCRIAMGWSVMIGDETVPMWPSWIGVLVAGSLSAFGLRLARRS